MSRYQRLGRMKMNPNEAIKVLADEAEEKGGTANDHSGTVRSIVESYGLGFNAWFCVCCELADRKAQRLGFENQAAMVLAGMRPLMRECR